MKEYYHRHIEDVKRIKKVISDNYIQVSLPLAAKVWEEYSDMFAAGWLFLPEDDFDLWMIIKDEVSINENGYSNSICGADENPETCPVKNKWVGCIGCVNFEQKT